MSRILNLQNVADLMLDAFSNAFSDIAKVTKLHIPTANMSARLEVLTKGYGTAAPTIGGYSATTHLVELWLKPWFPEGRGGDHLVRWILAQGRNRVWHNLIP